MNFGMHGKIAIVCARSRGLGRACAMELARESASITICAQNEHPLNKAAQAIHAETSTRVVPIVCDLTKGSHKERKH